MGISSVVQWWEEWQLRILVLGSLVIQWLLFISAIRRKHVISYWIVRSFIWLMYLGSDAIAIYALAALFNRQRKQDYAAKNNKSILELSWAPILLMHLGGQDCITAYNIEDNELWRRHVLIAVSQITVAIYVFCKSWPTGGHKELLQVSILVFIPGVLKCLEKPWALKKASINSLVISSAAIVSSRMGKTISLQEYVKKAKEIVDTDGSGLPESQAANEGNEEDPAMDEGDEERPSPPITQPLPLGIRQPSELFVDLACPYVDRIVTLQSFWVLDRIQAYASLQIGIYATFDLLYTKIKMTNDCLNPRKTLEERRISLLQLPFLYIRLSAYVMPLTASALLPSNPDLPPIFPKVYDENDVFVTNILFYCTTFLEYFSLFARNLGYIRKKFCGWGRLPGMERSSSMVAQYSLIGFFGRNQRHNIIRHIVGCFNCKELVDQLWCMKPCRSSAQITELVIEHVKKGWKEEIHDAASYRKFNDRRGQWTLGALNQQQQELGSSLRRPFDESVLIWHITTDVCFYTSSPHKDTVPPPPHGFGAWCEASPYHETAIRCREISQYMMYLLFVNPEMLLAGTRQSLFMVANDQLEEISKGQNRSSTEIEEIGIINILKSEQPSLSKERGGFFHDAMKLVRALHLIGDEKVWEVIQGVWVEMLCYSASRSRGYLHAKSLSTGGEFLTYVWLLLSHMGMETLPERLQGVELEVQNTDAAPSSSGTEMELQNTDIAPSSSRMEMELQNTDVAPSSSGGEIELTSMV